jgi:hypothetical protein
VTFPFHLQYDDMAIKVRVQKQVETGFRRRLDSEVERVFNSLKQDGNSLLRVEHLGKALTQLGIDCDDMRSKELFPRLDTNQDGGLDLAEFSAACKKSSLLEQWADSLCLAPMLADSLPVDKNQDPLFSLSEIGTREIEISCEFFCEALKILLTESISKLKSALHAMESRNCNSASSKFAATKMCCGNMDDFYRGLGARIGGFFGT